MVILLWLPARQAWLVNSWSLQFDRYVMGPAAALPGLSAPPANHVRSQFWLAASAMRSGNLELAESLIASKAADGDQFALHLMAEIRSKQGDFSGALAYWKQAGDVASLLQQALQAQQARQSEHALLAYTSAWELDQETITLPLADYLIDTLEDYPTAGDVLNRAMAARPNSRNWPLWSNRLGDVLRLQEHWDEAMAAYEGTLTRSPYDWAAYIGIGWTKYERGSGLQAAMEDFRKVTTIPDTQGNGEFAIAQVLTLEKRYEDADAWFQKAIPLYPEARGRYLARANAARQSGNLVLAIKVYQETIKKFPDYAIAYYEIAQAYRLNDQPEQATAAIEEAVARISPPSAAYYTRAGKIHEWAGEPAKALEAYRQALQIDPGNPEALKGVERLGK